MPKESFELLTENAGEVLDTLSNVTAILENVLLHQGRYMPYADYQSRSMVAKHARALLTKLGQE